MLRQLKRWKCKGGHKKCRKHTYLFPLCPPCMQEKYGLRIGPSRRRGLGVFATRRLPARCYLPSYGGERTSDKKLIEMYGSCGGAYAMGFDRRSFDAQVSRSWVSMINHPFRSEEANVMVVGLHTDKHFTQGQLLRDVNAGEELLLDYNAGKESGEVGYNFKPMKGCNSSTENLWEWYSGKDVHPKVHVTRK